MVYDDLKIIMSKKFLRVCKNDEVIKKAIETIIENIDENYKIIFTGDEWGMFGKNVKEEDITQTLFYKLEKKETK